MEDIKHKDIVLSNGVRMPQLGFGLYLVNDREKGIAAIRTALEHGYRLMDGAHYYHNDDFIWEAMKEAKIWRHQIFYTTKIENFTPGFKPEDTHSQIKKALKILQTDYLDLVLVHWPASNSIAVYKILEEYYNKGTIKAIGVSNFTKPLLEDFIKHVSIKPMVNQIQLSPALNRQATYDYCMANDIAVTAWRSLGPRSSQGATFILTHPTMVKIAEAHKATVPQVALKWAIQKGIAVIPKSVVISRVIANGKLDFFELTDQEIQTINDLEQVEPYWPFKNISPTTPHWD